MLSFVISRSLIHYGAYFYYEKEIKLRSLANSGPALSLERVNTSRGHICGFLTAVYVPIAALLKQLQS
jgi:hypothetical protein